MKIGLLNNIQRRIINSNNTNSEINNNLRRVKANKTNNFNIHNSNKINKVLNPQEFAMLQKVFKMDNAIKYYSQSGTKEEKCLNVGCVIDIKS